MKQARDIRNSVSRPRMGSIKYRIWEISNECYQAGVMRLRAEVLKRCIAEGIHQRTASAEHCVWRKYMGLVRNSTEG